MRQGLLGAAPSSLRPVFECLRASNDGQRLIADMDAAGEHGLTLDDFDLCAKFLLGVASADSRAKDRMLTKLLGSEWPSWFPKNETYGDQQTSLLALAALGCVTAGGRKTGLIGASTPE